jgi:hypothetical protein
MPSRHTYGFAMEEGTTKTTTREIGDDEDCRRRRLVYNDCRDRRDDSYDYDLPEIELHNLMCSISDLDIDDVKFVPVDDDVVDDVRMSSHRSPKWIVCDGGDGTTSCDTVDDVIPMAASRAVLTHATFSICECLVVTDEIWRDSSTSFASGINGDDDDGDYDRSSIIDVLERMDVIDMSNPNMSRDSRTVLINAILRSIDGQDNDVRLRLLRWIMEHASYHDARERSPVLLHHASIARTATPRDDDRSGVRDERHPMVNSHYIFLGRRTSIGPAGTRGAPSRTLRRTHRGLLKEYALRERRFDNPHASRVTSTAMEPEIGFLMSNMALSGAIGRHRRGGRRKGTRVLDPCCGSGRLLLYAAASGATDLIGVDSDPNVWDAEEWDRRRGATIGGGTLRDRAIPTFFVGDVRHPTSTVALCSPDSIDAIVCDPPYNMVNF